MDQSEIQRIVDQVREALKSRDRSPSSDGVAEAATGSPQELPKLVTEALVEDAVARGEDTIYLAPGAIVTPLGRDALKKHSVAIASGLGGRQPAGTPTRTTPPDSRSRVSIAATGTARDLASTAGSFLREHSLTPVHGGAATRDAAQAAKRVAGAISSGTASWGIIIEPIGMAAAAVANRVPGIIAASCADPLTARWARTRLGANVLCVPSETTTPAMLREILDAWILTPPHTPPDTGSVIRELDGGSPRE